MYRLKHFFAKHGLLSKVLLALYFGACWLVLGVYGELNRWIALVGFLFCCFFYSLWVDAAPTAIMQKTLKALNEKCDPYPLLSETEKLLTYKLSPQSRQLVLLNRGVALLDVGEIQKAYDIYKSINIDVNASFMLKCLYYNNLFNVCMALEKDAEAGVWFEKLIQIYDSLKSKKAKEILRNSVESTKALELYRKGEYYKAVEQLNSVPARNMRDRVNGAVDHARFCIALGDKERAEESLNFAIANGNKLYCVRQAREMLMQIQKRDE